ncbi:hypothetical protein BJY24_005496 [Nocardia transvalensis]|uniref:Uncharacterized protein n=1 Tax=Nocardia transvalensis TaxID=37333 RepID=A0A7W9PI52_9NOCA|nr:hypothetical protein [Nocardia transvalensis]MBB5916584.1 hypothetical protein [Nocardia transvalensis]
MRAIDAGRAAAVLGAIALLLVAGCSTEGNPRPEYPDPGSLDAGAYGVEPLDAPADGNERYGRVLESTRMIEALIDPVEADPALTHFASPGHVIPLPTPATAAVFLAEPVRPVLERNGMLAGAEVDGSDVEAPAHGPVIGSARLLTTIVLRFPDAAAAERAARDIDAVDTAVSPENVAVPIPGQPAAHAHWRPTVPTLAATLATGDYVVSLLAGHTAPDLTALTTLADRAFAAQLPRLREFAATPADRLATLPLDPDGMIRRLVPDAPGRWSYPAVTITSKDVNAGWNATVQGHGVVYGPRASRLAGGDRETDHPVELRAVNGLNVMYRYADAATARRAFEASSGRYRANSGLRPASPPGAVPDARCWESLQSDALRSTRFLCALVHGRYVAAILTRELKTGQQKMAAQYGLLVNGE